MQEERGPRKTTRLRKLISIYAVNERRKTLKTGKDKDHKLDIKDKNFANHPNYGTVGVFGKF